jgi:hypothetical protein
MANSYTNVGFIEQTNGENATTWGDYTDNNWDIATLIVGGLASVDMSGGDVTPPNVNGMADAGKSLMFQTTGTLSANVNIILPTANRFYQVWNTCTGLFTLTVKTATGTGIVVPQGSKAILICDGTNIIDIGSNIESFIVAMSDETSALTAGNAKVTIRMPYAFSLIDVRASLTTASSSGAVVFDVNEAGVTIFSTKLTIDAGATTSTTATTPYVFSDTFLANDAQITFDIDAAGMNATGAKLSLIGRRSS